MTSALQRPFVHSVIVDWSYDPHGEPDYLERTASDHFGDGWLHVCESDRAKVVAEHGSVWAACEHYAKEDAKRLREFRAGSWSFESCRAVAEIRYEVSPGTYRIENLSSGSLCGIESDSGDEYRRQVELEQLGELSSHLERFGVHGCGLEELEKLVKPGIPQSRWGDFVDAPK